LDFGGYVVPSLKYNLPNNNYINYTENVSSLIGLNYERFLKSLPISVKGGFYINHQYRSVLSLHIPLEINGNLLGNRNESFAFLGYTGGFSYNKVIKVIKSFSMINVQEGFEDDISIKKENYLAPHAGLNAGFNFKKFSISTTLAFHFFVPEFVEYSVKNISKKTIEYNTNKNYGLSFRIGCSYRFF
jgi:hypothetical protein